MPQVDIITGEKRHRRWSLEEKQSIVAAAFAPGVRPTDIAKRAQISTGQLYTWRKELVQIGMSSFAPVVAVAEPGQAAPPPPVIELELSWGRVRMPASISPELAAAIIGALVER